MMRAAKVSVGIFTLVSALSLGSTSASAATAITDFDDGTVYTSYSGDETVGWSFMTSDAISIQSLGWFATSGTLLASHEIGIWDLAGNLLGSTTITPGAADASGFVFSSVVPFSLAAGTYLIGGRDTSSDGDNYVHFVNNLTTAAGITHLGAARSANGSGFSAPTITSAGSGRFGANFQFSQVSAVPEPATWALMLLGFGLVGGAMRSQRRQKLTISYS